MPYWFLRDILLTFGFFGEYFIKPFRDFFISDIVLCGLLLECAKPSWKLAKVVWLHVVPLIYIFHSLNHSMKFTVNELIDSLYISRTMYIDAIYRSIYHFDNLFNSSSFRFTLNEDRIVSQLSTERFLWDINIVILTSLPLRYYPLISHECVELWVYPYLLPPLLLYRP